MSLINYYNDSMALISNNNEYSDIFKTSIGVKQGGPLSPRLFAMYIEDLITEIETSEAGIKIKDMKIDIIMYADDILLVSDSQCKLQVLLDITEKYGKKWEIKFNPEKTLYMEVGTSPKINNKRRVQKPTFDDKEIMKVDKMKYLGMFYTRKIDNKYHLNKKSSATFNAMNRIKDLGIDSNLISTEMKASLYKTYCRPILYYGIENLMMTEIEKKKLQTTEANIVKRSFELSSKVKTTNLIYGVGLEQSIKRTEEIKMSFLERLYKNSFTKEMIETILEDENYKNKKSIINEIRKITKSENENDIKIILENSKIKLKKLKDETKKKLQSEEIKNIKLILNKNGKERTEKLREILNAF